MDLLSISLSHLSTSLIAGFLSLLQSRLFPRLFPKSLFPITPTIAGLRRAKYPVRLPVRRPKKVDVFSFGIVLWEILIGEEPHANMHYGAIIGGIVNHTLRPTIPSSFDLHPYWMRHFAFSNVIDTQSYGCPDILLRCSCKSFANST